MPAIDPKTNEESAAVPIALQSRFGRYAGVGAIGTAAHYAVLIALVQGSGMPPVFASTAGAVVGTLINYALNYRFTFASQRAHRLAFPRFVAIAIASVLINAAILIVCIDLLGLNYIVAQFMATAVVLVAGFAANRKWTF